MSSMNRLKSSLLILVMLTTSGAAQAETRIQRDIVYGHLDGLGLIYDVLQPEAQNGAAIVLIQSGAFVSRYQEPEVHEAENQELLDAGYTVIVLYHGNDRWERVERLAELQRGIRHIRLNAARFGIDPDRIGVTGNSTGGTLALLLGVRSDDGDPDSEDEVERSSNHVAAVVAGAAIVDYLAHLESHLDDDEALDEEIIAQTPEISAYRFVDSGDPPTLLMHGDADDYVDPSNSKLMYETLRANDVPTDLILVEGAEHGDFVYDESGAQRVLKARLDWFGRYLLDK